MRLACAYFDTKKTGGLYTRCAKVWEYSAGKNSGADAVDLIELEPTKGEDPFLFNANHAKLLVWRDYVRQHDEDIILMDADTIVMGDLRKVFEQYKFDLGVTIRDGMSRFTMNGGVVYVRNTPAAQRLIDEWYESDCTLIADRRLHEKYRARYGGMNQSAYGHLLTKRLPGKIETLPCSRYNQVEWHRRRGTRPLVIHVKSYLRNAVFSARPVDAMRDYLRPAVKAWRDMEVAMLREEPEVLPEDEPVIEPEDQPAIEPGIEVAEETEKAPLQIIGVEFTASGACNYKRLAQVWKYSAQKAHPWADVQLVQLSPPHGRSSHQARNLYKLKAWEGIIQKAECNTIFMDVDMAIYHPIDDVFDLPFDVCYTRRTKTRMPLNGGVLFVKPTEKAKAFFHKWQRVDQQLLQKRSMYQEYVRKYGGQNQASFGWMLKNAKHAAVIAYVDCTTYNCCNEEWPYINEATRVVHYKSSLKRICSKSGDYRKYSPKYEVALKKWRAMEKEMLTNTGVEERPRAVTAPTARSKKKWQTKTTIRKDKRVTRPQTFPTPM